MPYQSIVTKNFDVSHYDAVQPTFVDMDAQTSIKAFIPEVYVKDLGYNV